MKFSSQYLISCLCILPILRTSAAAQMPQTSANTSMQKGKTPILPRPITIQNFNSGVIVFSHDNKMLANGVPGQIQIWSTRNWKLLRTLRAPQIKAPFSFSPDGKTMTLSVANDRMQIWDVRTAKPIKTLPGFRTHIAFSPDGSLMAGWNRSQGKTPVAEETTTIWEARTGRRIAALGNGASSSDQYVFSLDNKRLIIASVDNFIKIYDVANNKLVSDDDAFGDIGPPIVLSPDGKYFATITNGVFVGDDIWPETGNRPATDAGLTSAYSAKIWNAHTGKFIRSFGYWESWRESTPLGFTADSEKVIYNVGDIQNYDGGVQAIIFDVATGKELERFDIAKPAVLSPDGKMLVGGDKTLKVWAMP